MRRHCALRDGDGRGGLTAVGSVRFHRRQRLPAVRQLTEHNVLAWTAHDQHTNRETEQGQIDGASDRQRRSSTALAPTVALVDD